MFKTKGNITAYAFGTGEKVKVKSEKIIPWNTETDEWYDLSLEDKKDAYDYTCARMAVREHFESLIPILNSKERNAILDNYRNIFKHVERDNFHIQNVELVMIYHDEDDDRFLAAWVSVDDLEK